MVLLQFIQTLAIGLGLTAGQNVLALGIAAAATGRLLAALAAFVAPLTLLLVQCLLHFVWQFCPHLLNLGF